MRKIRKLYFFDKKNTEEMISFLNNNASDNYINHIMFHPLLPLHHLLPINFKFLPESFILKDNHETKGLITIAPNRGKNKKIEIQKLFFEDGAYSDASELIQFVVSKYKALGATSILVKVDDYLPELLNMLISKCGFSQISYEKLWRVTHFTDTNFNKKEFHPFKNSDSEKVTTIYNNYLLPHFRPLLSKETQEFKENFFKGLSYYSEYKYIIEDKETQTPTGCIIIQTFDNENYILDIVQTGWTDLNLDSILAYAIYQIKKRKKRFGLFIKTKRYTQTGEKYEEIFTQKGFECVQNQIVLTNSTAQVLKENIKTGKYTIIGDFNSSGAMPVSKHIL